MNEWLGTPLNGTIIISGVLLIVGIYVGVREQHRRSEFNKFEGRIIALEKAVEILIKLNSKQ